MYSWGPINRRLIERYAKFMRATRVVKQRIKRINTKFINSGLGTTGYSMIIIYDSLNFNYINKYRIRSKAPPPIVCDLNIISPRCFW